jgi:hypothetical protein
MGEALALRSPLAVSSSFVARRREFVAPRSSLQFVALRSSLTVLPRRAIMISPAHVRHPP